MDWARLRAALGVSSIADLWSDPKAPWRTVADAEVEAARSASPIARTRDALAGAAAVAILSDNSERAVEAFLERHPDLVPQLRVVVGRESLQGPKSDHDVFATGFTRCLSALAPFDRHQLVYLGDQRYELEFARGLGARAVDATDPVVSTDDVIL